MIVQIFEKPKGCFEILPDKQVWFELFDHNGVYAYVAIDFIKTSASFHIQVLRWSPKIAKSLKEDWEEIKMFCKKYGVKELIASNVDVEDVRWPKFIKLFGFPYPYIVSISKQEL